MIFLGFFYVECRNFISDVKFCGALKLVKKKIQETESFPRLHISVEDRGFTCVTRKFIGTLDHNIKIIDKKTQYFVTIGMNSLVGLSDEAIDDQIDSCKK